MKKKANEPYKHAREFFNAALKRLEYLADDDKEQTEEEETEIGYLSLLMDFYEGILYPTLDLSKKDAEIFFEGIVNVKEPNEALKHAAEVYKKNKETLR